MTVNQLIESLSRFDGNLPVTVNSDSVDLFSFEIESVGLTSVYADRDYVGLYGNPNDTIRVFIAMANESNKC